MRGAAFSKLDVGVCSVASAASGAAPVSLPQTLPKRHEITATSRLTPSRREAIIAQLTKDRDALIKSKREIKMKFDAVESYLVDHTRVRIEVSPTLSFPSPWRLDRRVGNFSTLLGSSRGEV